MLYLSKNPICWHYHLEKIVLTISQYKKYFTAEYLQINFVQRFILNYTKLKQINL